MKASVTKRLFHHYGERAYTPGATSPGAKPVDYSPAEWHAFVLGWWGACYRQQGHDAAALRNWLLHHVSVVTCDTAAMSLSTMLMAGPAYDRNQPIVGNVIAGITFDVPAVATLEPAFDEA